MFENLKLQSEDKIMALMSLYKADERKEKIDLGVGVYKNNKGQTPIMDAVQKASRILNNTQKTKSYVGLSGNLGFIDNISQLVLADAVPKNQIIGAQAPGGTGAFHQLLLLIRSMEKDKRVWISSPSWPNHAAILNHLGIQFNNYNYFDYETCEVNFPRMMSDLQKTSSGDVLLLHGCCHNPTGADLNTDQWVQIADVISKKNLITICDFAYQGLGEGIENDAIGVRTLLKKLDNLIICSSYSKNFGLYSERVGCLIYHSKNMNNYSSVQSNFKKVARTIYSNPPSHGSDIVKTILSDEKLKLLWVENLDDAKNRIINMRKSLVENLVKENCSRNFEFIVNQKGMFSFTGLTSDEVAQLKEKFSIYIVNSGRINVAGVTSKNVNYIAKAISSVT